MILIENKEDIIDSKVWGNIYWKEDNIAMSSSKIWYIQDMSMHTLLNSNWLLDNIYNDINRE
jgi:hypothetical protein